MISLAGHPGLKPSAKEDQNDSVRSLSTAFLLLAALVPAGIVAATSNKFRSPAMGWVTDLTGTLPLQTVTELNRVGDHVQAETGAEMAVVVIGSTDGAPPATRLPYAGLVEIGDPRKQRPALLVAVNDGTTEIVWERNPRPANAGKPNRPADEMAPRLQKGDPAGAVLHGAAACARRLLAPR